MVAEFPFPEALSLILPHLHFPNNPLKVLLAHFSDDRRSDMAQLNDIAGTR